jgi:ATP-binding cassette subfamily B protein RaxB
MFSSSLKGLSLADLIDHARVLNFASRPIRVELSELSKMRLPCVIHWDMDHFVVLVQVSERYITIHDPAVGIRKLRLEEASRHFTGVALELTAGPQFARAVPPPPISLRRLAGSVDGLKRSLFQLFALAGLLELLSLLAPQLTQAVVDQVLADGDHDLLTLVGISFSMILIFQVVFTSFRTWLVTFIGTQFNLNWSGNVFQHLLRLPQEYFLKRHLGDIVSRFGSIANIQQTLTTQFVSVMLDGVMAVLTLAMLVVYSASLAAITVSAALAYAVIRTLYFRVYREANLSQIIVNAKQQSTLMESVRGVSTVRLQNKGSIQTSRFMNVAADALNTSVVIQRLNLAFTTASSFFSGAQRIGVIWLGASLALDGSLSAGMLMAYVAYADQFSERWSSLVDYFIQLRMLRLQAERLADIVLTPPEPFEEGTYAGPDPVASIRFENVCFRYAENEPWILFNASFEVGPGESVAITGSSGCGKSTIARLILGMLEPQMGAIYIGNINIRHFGKRRARDMMGSVMQDDRLFSGSVADNISFFDKSATPELVQAAAHAAELHDDIVRMPMGYHNLVGDMGNTLSGGQRQRLIIARCLYRKTPILILDEATSHLDAERERLIVERFKLHRPTVIAIAHRPETLARADRVLVMHAGSLAPAKLRGRLESEVEA